MTETSKSPLILIVDDKPEAEEGRAGVISALGLRATVKTPQEVTIEDIQSASVVAVDEYLEWDSNSHPETPVFFPVDGLAVIRMLQRHAWANSVSPAFVLRSGELAKLGAALPTGIRESALAAQHDLDWAFNKNDERESRRIVELADATHSLRQVFAEGAEWDGGAGWLGLKDSEWSKLALAQVDACRPPDSSVADYTAGSSWLRWFTQKILPYPSFLLSDLHTSLRLRLSLQSFEDVIESDSELSRLLRPFQYRGHLREFCGRRWWRAGIEMLIDGIVADADWDTSETDALTKRLSDLHGERLDFLDEAHPVVAIDSDYIESPWVIDSAEAVRLSPDLWPVFADEPWASIEDVQDDAILKALVAKEDRARI
ncbi:hypothetical protein [Streptomyces europaeiscabiei]|uniref:hypothetical protein n=1 Tax=Streptomyces europaeiscabiei TaxID=146819 RepID=UPI00299FD0B5|nr:hypothetical protein [Streptomyces europaeiscabiei]MDX3615972.1 hypothetical protein [Streptomyces europaeiscabiei]